MKRLLFVLFFLMTSFSLHSQSIRANAFSTNRWPRLATNQFGYLTNFPGIGLANSGTNFFYISTGTIIGEGGLRDDTLYIGYNKVDINSNDYSFYQQFETKWKTGGVVYDEWYLQRTDTDGRFYRPIATMMRSGDGSNMVVNLRGEVVFYPSRPATNTSDISMIVNEDRSVSTYGGVTVSSLSGAATLLLKPAGIGIGTTLQQDSINCYWFNYEAGGSLYYGTLGTLRMTINSSGNVGINTLTIPERLTVDGNISSSGWMMPTNGLIISSNSWVNPPTLAFGQNFYCSSNGVPHVIWKDQSGTLTTNRLVP